MKVLIGVPAWNEEACLAATLDSLLALDHPHVQVIVVDDYSTDDTLIIARQYELAHPGKITAIRAPQNMGSKAKALGLIDLTKYEADIFVCVDADTTLEPDAMTELLTAFDDPKCVIASGNVRARLPAAKDQNFWQSARSAEYVTGQRIAKEAQQKWGAVLIASGCLFAVRTWFMLDNRFSERTMAEDMDLTWTAIEQGYNICYVPTATCWVNDPYNYHTYWSQVSRWYRGYFQNIKVRRGNLFQRPKLGIVAYIYLLTNITGFPMFAYAAYMYPKELLIPMAVSFTILVAYYYPTKHLFHSIKGVAKMFLLSFLNYAIFMDALIKELIIGRKLTTWVKGH